MIQSTERNTQENPSEQNPIISQHFTQIGVSNRIQSIEIHLSTDQAIMKLVKPDGTQISPYSIVGFPKITNKQQIDVFLKLFYIKVTELKGDNTTEYKVDCLGRLLGGGVGCSCMAKNNSLDKHQDSNENFVQQGCRTNFSHASAEEIEQALTYFDRALSSQEIDSENRIRNFLLPYFKKRYDSNISPQIYKESSLLHLSSSNVISALLKSSLMDPNALDGYGNTALVHAALLYISIPNFTAFYTMEICKALLENGANINASVNEWWEENDLKGKTAFDLFKDATVKRPLDTGLLEIIELFSSYS